MSEQAISNTRVKEVAASARPEAATAPAHAHLPALSVFEQLAAKFEKLQQRVAESPQVQAGVQELVERQTAVLSHNLSAIRDTALSEIHHSAAAAAGHPLVVPPSTTDLHKAADAESRALRVHEEVRLAREALRTGIPTAVREERLFAGLAPAEVLTLMRVQQALGRLGLPTEWVAGQADSYSQLRLGQLAGQIGQGGADSVLPMVALRLWSKELETLNAQAEHYGLPPFRLPALEQASASLTKSDTLFAQVGEKLYLEFGGRTNSKLVFNRASAAGLQAKLHAFAELPLFVQESTSPRMQADEMLQIDPDLFLASTSRDLPINGIDFSPRSAAELDELISLNDRLQLGTAPRFLGISDALRARLGLGAEFAALQRESAPIAQSFSSPFRDRLDGVQQRLAQALALPLDARRQELLAISSALHQEILHSNGRVENAEYFENTTIHRTAEFVDLFTNPLAGLKHVDGDRTSTIASRSKAWKQTSDFDLKRCREQLRKATDEIISGDHGRGAQRLLDVSELAHQDRARAVAYEYSKSCTEFNSAMTAINVATLSAATAESLAMNGARQAELRGAQAARELAWRRTPSAAALGSNRSTLTREAFAELYPGLRSRLVLELPTNSAAQSAFRTGGNMNASSTLTSGGRWGSSGSGGSGTIRVPSSPQGGSSATVSLRAGVLGRVNSGRIAPVASTRASPAISNKLAAVRTAQAGSVGEASAFDDVGIAVLEREPIAVPVERPLELTVPRRPSDLDFGKFRREAPMPAQHPSPTPLQPTELPPFVVPHFPVKGAAEQELQTPSGWESTGTSEHEITVPQGAWVGDGGPANDNPAQPPATQSGEDDLQRRVEEIVRREELIDFDQKEPTLIDDVQELLGRRPSKFEMETELREMGFRDEAIRELLKINHPDTGLRWGHPTVGTISASNAEPSNDPEPGGPATNAEPDRELALRSAAAGQLSELAQEANTAALGLPLENTDAEVLLTRSRALFEIVDKWQAVADHLATSDTEELAALALETPEIFEIQVDRRRGVILGTVTLEGKTYSMDIAPLDRLGTDGNLNEAETDLARWQLVAALSNMKVISAQAGQYSVAIHSDSGSEDVALKCKQLAAFAKWIGEYSRPYAPLAKADPERISRIQERAIERATAILEGSKGGDKWLKAANLEMGNWIGAVTAYPLLVNEARGQIQSGPSEAQTAPKPSLFEAIRRAQECDPAFGAAAKSLSLKRDARGEANSAELAAALLRVVEMLSEQEPGLRSVTAAGDLRSAGSIPLASSATTDKAIVILPRYGFSPLMVQAIAKLPELQRKVIICRHGEGLTIEETAERLKIPIEEAREQFRVGTKSMRDYSAQHRAAVDVEGIKAISESMAAKPPKHDKPATVPRRPVVETELDKIIREHSEASKANVAAALQSFGGKYPPSLVTAMEQACNELLKIGPHSFADFDYLAGGLIAIYQNMPKKEGDRDQAIQLLTRAAEKWADAPRGFHRFYLSRLERNGNEEFAAQLLARRFPPADSPGNTMAGGYLPEKFGRRDRVFLEEHGQIVKVLTHLPSADSERSAFAALSHPEPGAQSVVLDVGGKKPGDYLLPTKWPQSVTRVADDSGQVRHIVLQQAFESCHSTCELMLVLDLASNQNITGLDIESFATRARRGGRGEMEGIALHLRKGLEKHGFTATAVEVRHVEPQPLIAAIEKNGPAIVSIDGHVVVVDKIEMPQTAGDRADPLVTIRDPYHGWRIVVPWSTFASDQYSPKGLIQIEPKPASTSPSGAAGPLATRIGDVINWFSSYLSNFWRGEN